MSQPFLNKICRGCQAAQYAKHALLDKLFYSWWTELVVIKESLQRVVKWLPVLWRDRDWDSYHIWNVLETKIRFTRECIHKYGHHVNKARDVRNMRIAEILIKRIKEDDYSEMFRPELDQKWGKLSWTESCSKVDEDTLVMFDNKFSSRGLVRPNVKSQKDWEQERKDASRMHDHVVYLRQQDMEYLFKHLKKHIHKWWD